MPQFGNKPLHETWIRDHLDYPHSDWCLIWPFPGTNNGYGTLIKDRKKHYAHRLMCELVRGPAPTDDHQASHSCHRGHKGCVNPHHLRWKTRSENLLESSAALKRNKLTRAKADQIRTLKGIEPTNITAERFGVREATIKDVQAGRTWKPIQFMQTSGIRT